MNQTLNLLIAITLLSAGAISSKTAFADQTTLSLDDAKHLLFRTGFGAGAGELRRLIGKSREQAVEIIISGLRPAPELPMPGWTQQPAPHHWARGKLSRTDRRKFNESRDREINSLKVWWVRQIIETVSPQTERLALMWHNHFATAYSGINSQAIAVARQHQLIREHGSGNFGTMLKQMIRDPALLNYLDNDKSRKNSPNENLARELMELFTLGEGNYTESDVKNAARALTGYSVEPIHNMQFRFKPSIHDHGDKTIFGQTGKFDGDDLVDLILQQPHAATHIAQRFWQTYISEVPPAPSELLPLANAFRNSGYNLLTLYRRTLLSDAFWHPNSRASIVRSPVSLVLGTIRSTGIVPQQWQTLPTVLANMGQSLFDPPNVAGWPGGGHWITPSRLLYRMDWLEQLAKSCSGTSCNGSTETAAMKEPGNMMGSLSSTMTDPDTMLPTGTGSTISVRLAAEEFDDAVQYQVSIYRAEEKLWTSGRMSVVGGHNSKQLGRMKLDQDIPWQTVEFDVDANTTGFDKIEVEFLNDAASNGNDRNLFIDQVVYGNEQYLAATGSQKSSCVPKQSHYAGRLYCNGTLTFLRPEVSGPEVSGPEVSDRRALLLRADVKNEPDSASFSNKFTAEGVYLQLAQSPEGKNKALGITLANVTLNGRYWHTINTRFVRDDHKKSTSTGKTSGRKSGASNYALKLNNFSCWPNCVQQWPQCATRSKKDPELRTLSFPLIGNADNSLGNGDTSRCHYQSLVVNDKALIDALWHNIDRIFRFAREAIPAKRQQIINNSDRWSPHIDQMSTLYNESPYFNAGVPGLELIKPEDTLPVVEDTLVSSMPLPAGQTSKQRSRHWMKLLKNTPDLTLQSVLLPAPPLAETDESSLQDILTDLYVQLQ